MTKTFKGKTAGVLAAVSLVVAFAVVPRVGYTAYANGGNATLGGLQLNWTNRFAAGVAIRTQERDYRLVDKQNHPDNWAIYQEGWTVVDETFFPPGFDVETVTIPSGFYGLCEVPDGVWMARYEDLFGPGALGQPPPGFTNIGDCGTQTGDPAPGRRLINAPGGYNINGDDGNLNYDKGDVTNANLRLRSEITGGWRNFSFKLGGIAYHDPVNNPNGLNHPRRRSEGSGFQTHLADRPVLQYAGRTLPVIAPEHQELYPWSSATIPSGTTLEIDRSSRATRPQHVADQYTDVRVLEAYISGVFDVGGRDLQLTVGNQYLRWGESTFTIFNTLNSVNPLSAILWRQPGAEVRDAFLPVGMITANMAISDRAGFEFFYQYDWKPTEPDICGSYHSTSDVAGCGRGETPVYLASGNAPEDPLGQWRPGGAAGSQTFTSRTTYLLDERHGHPQNGKQFGLRLDYYSDLLGGTEFSVYGMNIHSRLPFYSTYAAEHNCMTGDLLRGNLYETNQRCIEIAEWAVDAGVPPAQRNIIGGYPVDTLQPFLDYPEDVRIFGLSATTTLGDWSFAGEISYSPNQPAQVSQVDVTYAGLQPAFSTTNYDGPYDDRLAQPRSNTSALVPSTRVSIPDYLMSRYRSGCGNNDWECERAASAAIQPGDYIAGFERLQVGQLAVTGIRMFSGSNPIAADQILFVGEVAAQRVFDMPPLEKLQFQGSGARMTHFSQGIADFEDGVHDLWYSAGQSHPVLGGPPCVQGTCRVAGPADRFNPERADPRIFANDFAWGYRVRVDATYNDLFWGIGIMPRVQLYHDVRGTSISPGQDFVHGRKEWTLSNDFIFNQNFSTQLRYVIFHGAGDRNLRGDRNYAEVSLSYAF